MGRDWGEVGGMKVVKGGRSQRNGNGYNNM